MSRSYVSSHRNRENAQRETLQAAPLGPGVPQPHGSPLFGVPSVPPDGPHSLCSMAGPLEVGELTTTAARPPQPPLYCHSPNPGAHLSPRRGHGLWVLQVGHHHGRDGEPVGKESSVRARTQPPMCPPPQPRCSHEAAHHLLCVLGAARVGEADEGAVDGDPGAPLQLQHQEGDDPGNPNAPKTVTVPPPRPMPVLAAPSWCPP